MEAIGRVTPLHYVTVEFRLQGESEADHTRETSGQHRFLYGVESWIDGIDQQLESLSEGEALKLLLEPDTAAHVAYHLLRQDDQQEVDKRMVLELKIIAVAKAEPKEVVKALAASVHCCDHCGSH
jgi:FKBP-type peptidyl-prolyl cis-trans isomerase 2